MSCTYKFKGVNTIYNSKRDILVAYYDVPFQLQGTESSKAGEVSLAKVKEFLKRIGVDIKTVTGIVVNGNVIQANAVSKILQNLIEVVDGKEDVALTEEAMHFAVELLEKHNPTLYKEMFNKIGQYNIFKDTMREYKDVYTINGKPDIIKIKKEAIAKLLTEQFININEGLTEKPELLAFSRTIWERMKDWLKKLFTSSDYNPFIEAAKIVGGNDLMYQLNTQENVNTAIKELDDFLIDYLKPFGVRVKEFDDLKSRLNIDAVGATDIINKLIWLSKNRNVETVPEEFGHMITFLLGENHPDIRNLLKEVESWSEYKSISEQYMPVYGNTKQVKIEAIGKLLAKALVRNYEAVGTDKTLIESALRILEDFFRRLFSISGINTQDMYVSSIADRLALKILSQEALVDTSIKSGYVKVNSNKAFQNNPLADKIRETFTKSPIGAKLTGSLALAFQGDIFRNEGEPIHDLDFVAYGNDQDLQKLVDQAIKMGGIPFHFGWRQSSFTTYSFLIPKEGSKITSFTRNKKGWLSSYTIDGQKGNKSNSIAVDFFWFNEKKDLNDNLQGITSANDVFRGKLFLSPKGDQERLFQRPKDQKDFILYKPSYVGKSDSAFIFYQLSPNKQKDEVAKLRDVHSRLSKIEDGKGKSHYEIAGRKIKHRVSDITHGFYAQKFKNGDMNKSEYQKAVDDTKRDKGTDIHKDLEDIFHRYVDDNGLLRATPLPQTNKSLADPNDNSIYRALEKNLAARLAAFEAKAPGTVFMSEVMIYDETKDEAGTIDFLAIEPDGTTHILDWKSMEINTTKYQDIPWYKVEAYQKQIEEYKRILKDKYRINKWGQTRAIPIQATYEYIDPTDKKAGIRLKSIKIGNVDATKETNPLLLPVGLKEETTGDAKIDEAINKLNFIYKQLSAKSVKEGRKDIKAAQLNALFTAIRQLQMRKNILPLIEQGKTLISQMDDIAKIYEDKFKGKDPNTISKEDISSFADELADILDELGVYSNMNIQFDKVFDKNDPDQKKVIDEIGSLSSPAQIKLAEFGDISKEFASTMTAERLGIKGLLNPEKVVKGWARMFRSLSQGATTAVRTLYRLETTLRHRADIEADEENKKLDKIKEDYDTWAKSKGLNSKNYFDAITKKDKNGRYVHQQIDKYDPKFFTEFDEKASGDNKKWVRDNVDIPAYVEYYNRVLVPTKLDIIDNIRYSADDKENEERKKKERQKFHDTFSLSKDTAWNNYVLRRYPLEKWESKEYKYLKQKGNEAALDFYNYINSKMKEAAASGAIEEKRANRLLPFMRKSTLEKLAFGGKVRLGEDFIRSISSDENDTVYGERDINTGEIKPSIPFFFVRDIGVDKFDAAGEFDYTDYSDVSTDLFKLMKLFNDQLYVFKYRTEIESQAKLLLRTEQLKGHIDTGRFGTVQMQNNKPIVLPGNEENAKYFEKFMKNRIFGQKYVDSEGTDIAVGRISNEAAKRINKFFHAEILSEDNPDRVISITKLLDTANRYFQQKVLGLNITVPISNFLGGAMQTTINSGKYMDKTDLAKAWARFTSQKFTGEEGKKYAGLIDYFLPLLDNQKYANARDSSVAAITKFSMSDFLMSIQRGSDKLVQYPLSIALMENTMVENGKLVNIRQFVRDKYNWSERYKNYPTLEARKQLYEKVDAEIEEIKSKRSLPKIAKIVNDTLVIDGIERNSDTVGKFREFIQQQAKNAVGNSTQEDISQIKMNAITNSFMVFKNWIPRLADVRVGELRYQEGTESWEYGRMRMFAKVLFDNVFKSLGRLYNITKGNEEGINYIREMFEKKREKWEQTHGTELELTEGEFIDLMREGIRMEMKELLFLIGMLSLFFLWKANAPDPDEDDEVKGFYKWSLRAMDKVTQELSFFYNPVSFDQIANGSIFPALGLLTDVKNVMQHTAYQSFGFLTRNDEIMDAAKPAKYWMKTFPILKEATTYIAILNKELADEMGIQQSSQARAR